MNALARRTDEVADLTATTRDRLTALAGRLGRFLAGSETVFLQTGDRLQGMADHATEIVRSSGSASTLETASQNPVADLGQTLSIMEKYLAASRESAVAGGNGLAQVIAGIEGLTSAGEEFQRIATTMHAIGTSLRVEDGRKALGFGFDSVSQDVFRLGRQIAGNFDAIVNRCEKLRGTALAARKREREFVSRQGARTEYLLGEAHKSLEALSELVRVGGAVRNEAVATSSRIGELVASILVALQTHDITRQMIEHVVQALHGFTAEGRPEKSGMSDEEYLADLSNLCRIQAQQVHKARQDLVDAQTGIAQTLRELSDDVEAVVGKTRHLADGNRQGESLLAIVERSMDHATESLRHQLAQERGTFAAILSVADAAKEMEIFVGQIAATANDAKVVALNALVKAVKTGTEGAVFAVLARTIKELSVGVAEKSAWVGEVMGEMVFLAQTLGQSTSERIEGEDIEKRLGRLIGDLRRHQEGLQVGLMEIRNGSVAIAGEVKTITGRLARQAQEAGVLDAVEREMLEIAEQAGMLAGDTLHVRKSRWAEAAADRYTMEVERMVHEAATGTSVGCSLPQEKSDLGSNVELF
jgi:hypothetical protein